MELFDLGKMPKQLVDRRNKFPRRSCVYFVFDEDDVLYVGQARSLYQRWMSHEILGDLPDDACVAWLYESDEGRRLQIEAEAIEHFRPRLNDPKNRTHSEVSLCVKVPITLRCHWAAESKRKRVSMTEVIIAALTAEFGKPE